MGSYIRSAGLVTALGWILAQPAAAQRVDLRDELSRLDVTLRAHAGRIRTATARAASGIAIAGPALAAAAPALAAMGVRLQSLEIGPREFSPPDAWDPQDPADSVYRAARRALNRGSYSQAAYLFNQIHERFGRSTYAADAFYWEAFARYRQGSTDGLRTALRLIERQASRHPDAATRNDASSLAARIQAKLAQEGDEEARRDLENRADAIVSPRGPRSEQRIRCDEDDDRMAVLNALLQMDADRALPILQKVMARRDEGSACLRRKAVFLISQHSGDDAERMLLAAVRSDPDPEVREQAVFWLSQVNSEHAAVALDSILRTSDDPVVQEKAIFALSQHDSDLALRSLRDFAAKRDAPRNLRENAIFWLGQGGQADNAGFLKGLYKSVGDAGLKEKIIFSIAQQGNRENQRWLIDLAADRTEDLEVRKKAIFWAGQSSVPLTELFSLYDRIPEREIREQLIFAYSQRRDRAAADKLIEIARTEKDRELRRKAVFWLTQSGDPRVTEVLEEILEK